MVANSVQVNEEVDPVMVVRRLKAEIVELKEEIALLKGGEGAAADVDEAAQDKIRSKQNQNQKPRASDMKPDPLNQERRARLCR
jgi:hypothetical protein